MINNFIYITEHAYIRMKERNGWSRKTADRMAERIYAHGIRPEQIKGYLKSWLREKINNDVNQNDYIVYGQSLYIFRENALITVIHTPSKGYVAESFF